MPAGAVFCGLAAAAWCTKGSIWCSTRFARCRSTRLWCAAPSIASAISRLPTRPSSTTPRTSRRSVGLTCEARSFSASWIEPSDSSTRAAPKGEGAASSPACTRGSIPLLTYETSVDVHDFGFLLEGCRAQHHSRERQAGVRAHDETSSATLATCGAWEPRPQPPHARRFRDELPTTRARSHPR